MQERSPDRGHDERLDSSRSISWSGEIKFYLGSFVLAQILYFGASEGMTRYLEWYRQRMAAIANAPQSCPPAQLSQQQLQAIQNAQRQAQVQVFTMIAKHAVKEEHRENARQVLRQLGAEVPAPPMEIALAPKNG